VVVAAKPPEVVVVAAKPPEVVVDDGKLEAERKALGRLIAGIRPLRDGAQALGLGLGDELGETLAECKAHLEDRGAVLDGLVRVRVGAERALENAEQRLLGAVRRWRAEAEAALTRCRKAEAAWNGSVPEPRDITPLGDAKRSRERAESEFARAEAVRRQLEPGSTNASTPDYADLAGYRQAVEHSGKATEELARVITRRIRKHIDEAGKSITVAESRRRSLVTEGRDDQQLARRLKALIQKTAHISGWLNQEWQEQHKPQDAAKIEQAALALAKEYEARERDGRVDFATLGPAVKRYDALATAVDSSKGDVDYTRPGFPAHAGTLDDWRTWAKEGTKKDKRVFDAAKAWLGDATKEIAEAICNGARNLGWRYGEVERLADGIFGPEEADEAPRVRKRIYLDRAKTNLDGISIVSPSQLVDGSKDPGDFVKALGRVRSDLDRIQYNVHSGHNFAPDGAEVIKLEPGCKWRASGFVSRDRRDTIDRWCIHSPSLGSTLTVHVIRCEWSACNVYADGWLHKSSCIAQTTGRSLNPVFEGTGGYEFECWVEDPRRKEWQRREYKEPQSGPTGH